MADIAAGAGMSRPALYLHYAGKEDIFNALVRVHFETSETAVERVLAKPGPPAEVLLAAFHAIRREAGEAGGGRPEHGFAVRHSLSPM